MASTLFGARVWQTQNKESNTRYDIIGKNSEVIAVGDILTEASGVAKVVAAATDPILGVSAKAGTMSSSNQTVALVYPPYIPADEGTVFLMGCNSVLTDNATDVGKFFGITGATGAQQVNVSGSVTTTTSRQVVIVKVDPKNLGTTEGKSEALVKFVSTNFSTTVN